MVMNANCIEFEKKPFHSLIFFFVVVHFRFKTKPHLNNHAKHHEDVRPYPCSECNRKFRRPYSLSVHMRSHTNTCPYTCRYCGKSFRHNITLQVNSYSTFIRLPFLILDSFTRPYQLFPDS